MGTGMFTLGIVPRPQIPKSPSLWLGCLASIFNTRRFNGVRDTDVCNHGSILGP